MHVSIDISKEAEDALRAEWGDLDQAAKESLLIESYRTGRISIGFLASVLGLDCWATERWLGERAVTWNYGISDFEADLATLAKMSESS